MILEVKHLRLVQAIAEEGGVTRASERLHLTQSALSHQLRELEERLGVPLFRRAGRRLVLSGAGHRIAQQAPLLLERLALLEHDVRGFSGDARNSLCVTTECCTTFHWLPSCLKALRERLPDLDVRLAVEAAPRPLSALLDGQIDLAITYWLRTASAKVVSESLFWDEMLVVMAPGHRLARRPHVEPEDFRDETLVTYNSLADSAAYREILSPAGVTPRRAVSVGVTEGVLEFARAGLGVAVVARWAAAPQLESGELVGVSLTRAGWHREWRAAFLKTRLDDERIRHFVEVVREEYRRTGFRRELVAQTSA